MELTVCRDALLRGADVFRNVSCVGKADLVFVKEGDVLKVDVKTLYLDPRTNTYASNSEKPLPGIYHVLIDNENWKPRWNKRHVPPGWENFWE
jgi:hypothetical protein